MSEVEHRLNEEYDMTELKHVTHHLAVSYSYVPMNHKTDLPEATFLTILLDVLKHFVEFRNNALRLGPDVTKAALKDLTDKTVMALTLPQLVRRAFQPKSALAGSPIVSHACVCAGKPSCGPGESKPA